MQPTDNSDPSKYGFIMNSGQPAKAGPAALLSGLPQPVVLVMAIFAGLIVLAVLYALIFGHKSTSSQPLVNLMARAQEISRVSSLAAQQSSDANTQALASTAATVLASQESQLSDYLAGTGSKVDPKALSVDQNSSTDAALQQALQNNNLEATYSSYLTNSLSTYRAGLVSQYQASKSLKLRALLAKDADSVQLLVTYSNPKL